MPSGTPTRCLSSSATVGKLLITATESIAKDTAPLPQTPAVVATTKGVSLADHLKLSDLPLATTPGGRTFTLKALHPSEHTIKSARVPGGNDLSVAICSDMVYTFPFTTNNSSAWIYQSPNIIVPCKVTTWSGSNVYYNFYNAAFGGAVQVNPGHTHTEALMKSLAGKITKYRVTSQSVTAELIAPALSDQGTVTAYQADYSPITIQSSSLVLTGGAPTGINVIKDVHIVPEPVNVGSALLGSSAYTAKARDGCYQPLKLRTFKWQNYSDSVIYYSAPMNTLDFAVTSLLDTQSCDYPFREDRAGVTDYTDLSPVPRNCGHSYGYMRFDGLSAGTSLRVRVRQVVEVVVPPGSVYAPMVELSLPPDDTALRMYFEISSRLKDGYPSSYNDIGKLVDTIKKIGNDLLPYVDPALDALQSMGGPVGTVAKIAKGAIPIVATGADIIGGLKSKDLTPLQKAGVYMAKKAAKGARKAQQRKKGGGKPQQSQKK